MIYIRQVAPEEKGLGLHLQELESNVYNQTDNIHEQYNNFKGNYEGLACFDKMLRNVPLSQAGIVLPFKLLQDETVNVQYASRITFGTPSHYRHGVEVKSKGVVLASYEEIPSSTYTVHNFALVITGRHTDGFIRIYKRGISTGIIPYAVNLYDLIIT